MATHRARPVLTGRLTTPVRYSAALAETILDQLTAGRTLRDICRGDGMPEARTVRRWIVDDHEGFAARYHRAMPMYYVALARQAAAIARDAFDAQMAQPVDARTITAGGEHITRSLLRIETRCWLLATFLPRLLEHRPAPAERQQAAPRDSMAA